MKKYSIISLIFIGLIGLFTFINTNSESTFNILGMSITFYNAVWVVLFLSIFYLISIIYFSIEKFKTFRFDRNIKKDKDNILKNIESKILYKDKLLEIKEMQNVQELVEMIEGLKIKPKESEIFPFMQDLEKLQSGEIVDLKKYKLDKSNPWVIKNLENKLNSGDLSTAKELLNTSFRDKAIKLLSKKADIKEILANDYPILKETILNNIENERIKELIDKSELSNKEYIQISQSLYKAYENPDFVLELCENKIVAYVYLLIEYEKLDEALELVKENELKLFEYYLLLRENEVKISIKEFLDSVWK